MPKRVTPLSDIQVKNAKPKDADYKLTDGGGLYLLITPTGGKLWRLDYRFDGKRKTFTFGSYPDVSLAKARDKRQSAREQIAAGIDPGAVKKAEKLAVVESVTNTFEAVAREWFTRNSSKWSENHAGRLLTRLEQDAFPFIGSRPIAEIKAPEVAALLKRIEIRTLEGAHRIKISMGQIFRYAVSIGKADADPVAPLRDVLPPVKNKGMAAPTDPKELTPLLRAIDGFTGSFVVKCAMQLAPLLFVRPGELRHAEWSEIDIEAGQWNLPAEKMKMKLPHLVPLSRQALAIIEELRPLTGSGRYLFPCNRSPLRCMSENSVNAGLRRMGFEKAEITGHGFRATARTILDEVMGERPDLIEHQLSHAVKDPLGRAYNRTSHLPERRKMMQRWADYLDSLKAVAKVIPFKWAIGE